jgi:hypothetical protein
MTYSGRVGLGQLPERVVQPATRVQLPDRGRHLFSGQSEVHRLAHGIGCAGVAPASELPHLSLVHT